MSFTPRALIRSVAPASGGSGAVPAPSVTGTLVGSWDFGDASKLHLTSTTINSIDGSDGTSVSLTSHGSPTTALDGSLPCTNLNGTTQYFDAANGLGITTGEYTVVAVVHPTSTASMGFLNIGNSGTSNSLNAAQLLGISAGGLQYRRDDSSSSGSANTVAGAYTAALHLLVGRSSATTASKGVFNVDGTATQILCNVANSGAAPTFNLMTIGARHATGSPDLFMAGYAIRFLVYNNYLSDADVEAIAVWAAANYGTPNNA